MIQISFTIIIRLNIDFLIFFNSYYFMNIESLTIKCMQNLYSLLILENLKIYVIILINFF